MPDIRNLLLTAALPLALTASPPALAQEDGGAAFTAWAAEALHPVATLDMDAALDDLAAFGEMVGDARIVAVSEAVHGGAEPLEMRNLLFRYLVEEKGFTAIAIESGIIESRVVDDYVRGGPGDFDRVMARGVGMGFHEYDANRDLVRWMRDANVNRSETRKLRFISFDVSGTPQNRLAERGVDTPLREALSFLERVDPDAAAEFDTRLEPILPALFWDLAGAMCIAEGGPWCAEVPEADRAALATQLQYSSLTAAERDLLTAAIADLIARIEQYPLAYEAASSPEDYAWGLRAAIAARQTDAFLRAAVPAGWSPDQGPAFGDGAQEGRSRAMADNMEWILERLGNDAKILVFASRFHIATAPIRAGDGDPVLPFGAEMKARHGDDWVGVANMVAEGDTACNMQMVLPVPRPRATSLDGMLARIGVPHFYLDMRAAPPNVAEWLRQPQGFQAGGVQTTVPAEAFDIFFYTGTVREACPIHPDAVRVPLPPGFED